MPRSSYCPSCGAEVASFADKFCRACGTSVSAEAAEPTPTPLVAMTAEPVNQPHARRGGDVLFGVVAGFLFGVVGVAANFLLNRNDQQKNERRKDRLFGSWFGLGAAGSVVAFVVVTFVALSGSPNAQADNPTSKPHTETPSVVAIVPSASRTAPEILAAVRSIHPDFCLPAHEDTKYSSSIYRGLRGPVKGDGQQWRVGCDVAAYLLAESSAGGGQRISHYECYSINADSLTVSPVDTGEAVSVDSVGGKTFGKSCVQ